MLNRRPCACNQLRGLCVVAAVAIGVQLVNDAACRGVETKLSSEDAKAIADQYRVEVGRLRELLDCVQAEGHFSIETANQLNPERRTKYDAQLKFFACNKKLKLVTASAVEGDPDAEVKSVYIFNGSESYSAVSKSGGKYSLEQRGPQNPRRDRLDKYNVYKNVYCPLSLSVFYIPDLISSADFNFRITNVDKIAVPGIDPTYKIHFKFEFGPAKLSYDGWLIADPRRHWAVTKFELTNDIRGSRKKISGNVTYDVSAEQLPMPLSISTIDFTTFTSLKNTEKVAAGTSSVTKSETMVFDRYKLERTPDFEFSLSSIGLGSAEFPPGENSNRNSYILGLSSIVALIGSCLIAYYLRRTEKSQPTAEM